MPKRPLTVLSTLYHATITTALLAPQKRTTIPSSTSRIYGLPEWREEALSSRYTLDCLTPNPVAPPQTIGTIPILPFPFPDIILQGQTKQLNLYEERFHLLFADVMENHHSIVGMGLLAGNGMVTTMPLCEVESFSRLGYNDDWVSPNDGMGNGSIFVTIRVVGRAKIMDELVQEEPYMKARVVEICDDSLSTLTGAGGVKEKATSKVVGEVDPLEVASLIAGNIETEILSIASMEHRWNKWREEMERRGKKIGDYDWGGGIDRKEVAKLEALFNQDSIGEGINLQNNNSLYHDDDDEEPDEDFDDEDFPDRRSIYHAAFSEAFESDTQGYITPTTSNKPTRTLKDLTAISWAAFCTSELDLNSVDDMQLNVFKIQALDTTNVLTRLQLGAAMLRMEKKKWRAKLALAGMGNKTGSGDDEEDV